MLPSPDILSEFPEGKFVLSNLAAKRAKQLREGAPPLVQVDSNHPLTIALAEIAAGKIKAIMPSADAVTIEAPEAALLIDETMPPRTRLAPPPPLKKTKLSLHRREQIALGPRGRRRASPKKNPNKFRFPAWGYEEKEKEVGCPTPKADPFLFT